MCRRTEVIMSKDGAQRTVTATIVQQRVGHPKLDCGLGSFEILAWRRSAENSRCWFGFEDCYRNFFDARQKRQGRRQAVFNLWIVAGRGRNRTFVKSRPNRALGMIDGIDAVAHLVRAEGAIFIVETIGCAVGCE